ncbi:MAG TPA: tRNA uridine-5-carboxymethylaminomethyl(34) synthesis GTPase MnmE, partial [Geminicoccaceae bacterium]|nr:tRNA uridine-5-carboxymethylaminomethyl(34) synthesis GTPase MnmE [Geminicoccaceae bacterium]
MTDTIFAPATAPGRSALAVIRLSGPACADVCRSLTKRDPPAPRRASLRRLLHPASGEAIDQGLLLWF